MTAKDRPLPPVERFLIFGDYCLAEIKSATIMTGDDGLKYVEFKLKLTEATKFKYNINEQKDYDDRVNWTITRVYPLIHCSLRDPNPRYQKWQLLCNYDGKLENSLTDSLNQELLETTKLQDQRISALKKVIVNLQHEMEEKEIYSEEHDKKQLQKWRQFKEVVGTSIVQGETQKPPEDID